MTRRDVLTNNVWRWRFCWLGGEEISSTKSYIQTQSKCSNHYMEPKLLNIKSESYEDDARFLCAGCADCALYSDNRCSALRGCCRLTDWLNGCRVIRARRSSPSSSIISRTRWLIGYLLCKLLWVQARPIALGGFEAFLVPDSLLLWFFLSMFLRVTASQILKRLVYWNFMHTRVFTKPVSDTMQRLIHDQRIMLLIRWVDQTRKSGIFCIICKLYYYYCGWASY